MTISCGVKWDGDWTLLESGEEEEGETAQR